MFPGKEICCSASLASVLDSLEEQVIIPARAVTDAEQRLRTIITSHVHLITSRSTPQGNNPVTIVVDEVAGLTRRSGGRSISESAIMWS